MICPHSNDEIEEFLTDLCIKEFSMSRNHPETDGPPRSCAICLNAMVDELLEKNQELLDRLGDYEGESHD